MFTINDLATATFSPLYRNGERVDGWYVMYDLDECERCGIECQGPNGVNVQLEQTGEITLRVDRVNQQHIVLEVRAEQFLKAMKQYREELPDELGYSEGFGGAVCSHCYQLEEGGV